MNKAIVIHSDILGFKQIIRNAENDENDETLNKIKLALQESFNILKMFSAIEEPTSMKISYKLFSDNLYASFSYKEGDLQSFSDAIITAVIFAKSYFANMLSHNIAVRGGISFGNDYNDETMIFSIGLVKAYTLEEKAIYPRIVIDNELIDIIKLELEFPSEILLNVFNNCILEDQENVFFINPNGLATDFDSELDGHKGSELDKIFIRQNIQFFKSELLKIDLDTEEGMKINQKYQWLMDITLWNYFDRQIGPKANTFKPLLFNIK